MSSPEMAGEARDGHPESEIGLNITELLPPRPQEPLPSDCCGEGCTPCVYDLYNQDVAFWEAECQRIREGGGNTSDSNQGVLSPDHYKKFQLASISPETLDSSIYTFTIASHGMLPLGLCQHLVLRRQRSDKVITRQYTPISSPESRGKMQFVIKLYEPGEMSGYIRDWMVGDLVEWRGPFGNFSYKPNSYKHIVMVAAGTGIAPMVQLIRHVLADDNDETRLHLVYACRTYSAILCKNLLDEWSGFWNFSVIYVLSQDVESSSPPRRYGDNVLYGKLTAKLLHSLVADFIRNVRILICGTKSFDKDMINHAKNIGIPESDIFKF